MLTSKILNVAINNVDFDTYYDYNCDHDDDQDHAINHLNYGISMVI